jgi:hypothetical protein
MEIHNFTSRQWPIRQMRAECRRKSPGQKVRSNIESGDTCINLWQIAKCVELQICCKYIASIFPLRHWKMDASPATFLCSVGHMYESHCSEPYKRKYEMYLFMQEEIFSIRFSWMIGLGKSGWLWVAPTAALVLPISFRALRGREIYSLSHLLRTDKRRGKSISREESSLLTGNLNFGWREFKWCVRISEIYRFW